MEEKLNWPAISAQSGLTEEFLENNIDYLNINIICVAQELSAEFIFKHDDILNLPLLMICQTSFKDYITIKRERQVYDE